MSARRTRHEVALIFRLLAVGNSTSSISRKLGIPLQTVRDQLAKRGCLPGSQGRRHHESYRFRAVRLFGRGLSMRAISQRLSIDGGTARRWLAEFGIDSRGDRGQKSSRSPRSIRATKPKTHKAAKSQRPIRLDAKARAMMAEIMRERGIRR